MTGRFRAHGFLKGEFGQARRDVPQETVSFVLGITVNHLKAFIEFTQQFVNFLRRMLQVVIHRHNRVKPGCPDAAEQGIVLPVIPHQIDSANPGMRTCQFLDYFPALIPAAVVDEHKFIRVRQRNQRRFQPLDQHGQNQLTVVNRDHDRDAAGGF